MSVRAGVVPHTITLNGEDQDAFIAEANLERRDLTRHPARAERRPGAVTLKRQERVTISHISLLKVKRKIAEAGKNF
ncbi:hypothetical protein [Paraburkholderia sp. J7]|uniref:hypothetical protein n=1 Tax=Paraburkholderia sp. J7 TaxID=2805438 RepID=UPI002AB63E1E|nr:hypothetical protein [Paraburkholderia sp. J7]